MWKIIFGILTIVSTFWGVSCSSNDSIQVEKAWVHLTPSENTAAAAYFTVTNKGDEPDALLAISSQLSEKMEMIETVETAGTPVTNALSKLEIGPGKSVIFAPEGKHATLPTLKQDLIEGETVPLNLVFEKAGVITVDALIESPSAMAYHKPRG